MGESKSLHRQSILYIVVILLLLGSNGLVLWKNFQLRNSAAPKAVSPKSKAIETVMSQSFRSADGTFLPPDSNARYLVLFVFTQMDCSACLSELTTLNRLSQVRSDIKVYAMMSYASEDEIRQTRQNFGATFPILQDLNGELLESLHVQKTPWKFVLDAASRKIIYEDIPSLTEVEREAFVQRVLHLDAF